MRREATTNPPSVHGCDFASMPMTMMAAAAALTAPTSGSKRRCSLSKNAKVLTKQNRRRNARLADSIKVSSDEKAATADDTVPSIMIDQWGHSYRLHRAQIAGRRRLSAA